MKKNYTFNFVFLFLCILLLGFVYLNNRMPNSSFQLKQKAVQEKVATGGDHIR